MSLLLGIALADPCGMVIPPPPPQVLAEGGTTLRRDGAQRTYIAFEDGIETMVLRPGFVGEVDEFGMLIPFPSPPTLRKVDENVFSHVEAAVDPPPLIVDVTYSVVSRGFGFAGLGARGARMGGGGTTDGMGTKGGGGEPSLGYYEVAILREEAVGMYEVAVLQAGSPEALQTWMESNGFMFPEGMDEAVWAYVEARWAFVAIKARIGDGAAAVPFPGMRETNTERPEDTDFDGFVQAMGFRFETEEPVLPMRLSAYNATTDTPRNVVYMLTEEPVSIVDLPHDLVKRQVTGKKLREHMTAPLPVWVRTGQASDLHPQALEQFAEQRAPERFNGVARELIASDLVALEQGKLVLDFESQKTELLNISERLHLRGEEIDARHADEVEAQQSETLASALDRLDDMTLTVLDGYFDVEVLKRQNLRFEPFTMPETDNAFRVEALKPTSPVVSVPNTWRPQGPSQPQPPKPRPVATPLATSITGVADPEAIDAVLGRNRNQITYCYVREQTKQPQLEGTVKVAFTVRTDGQVDQVEVRSNTTNDAVGRCVQGRLARLTFPGGDGVTLVKTGWSFEAP